MLRIPLLRISGRSCHKLNLELEFLSKLNCGAALLSGVLAGSVSGGVSSLGELSSGSVCESCSRLVSISWRVDLSRYSWYKSPRRQHNRSERLQLNKRTEEYCGNGGLCCPGSPQQEWGIALCTEIKSHAGCSYFNQQCKPYIEAMPKSETLLTIPNRVLTVRWTHDQVGGVKEECFVIYQASKCFF